MIVNHRLPHYDVSSNFSIHHHDCCCSFLARVVCRVRQDYNNLCQCESLEDVKLNLQETDYDTFLSHDNKVTPAALQDRATKKLVRFLCLARLLLSTRQLTKMFSVLVS